MMIWKKIFRYRLTSVYFIVSQIIVFFAVFGALQIYDKAFSKERDRLSSMEKNRIELNVSTSDKKNILTDAAKSVEVGNAVASGELTVAFQEAGVSTRCEVILCENEQTPYPFVWGRTPGSQKGDSGKRQVVLGRDKFKYAFERNGIYYVTLYHEEYEVTGVIGSPRSDFWDYKVILASNCIGDNLAKQLSQQQSYVIDLYSNSQLLTDSYKIIYQNIKETDNMCNIVPYEKNSTGDSTISNTLAKNNVKVNWIVYMFCLLNCMIMSIFFIVQRRKEMAIKKAFGMSNIRILLDLAVNILILSVISFIVFLVLYLIWNVLFINNSNIVQLDSFNIIITISAMLLSVLVTLLYPIYKIFHMNAASAIGGEF